MKNELLLKIVVCPFCYAKLFENKEANALICSTDHIVFPVNRGIAVFVKTLVQDLNCNKIIIKK